MIPWPPRSTLFPYTTLFRSRTKPESVNKTCAVDTEEDARNVGSTPSIAQGCRPYSATNQPSSAASHGSGSDHRKARNSHLREKSSLDVYQKAAANKKMK